MINWIKDLFRTYKPCQGVGCYVDTIDRHPTGRPFCSCCKQEGVELKPE